MKAVNIKAMREAAPFVPFTISLGDGRKFSVRHPDFLAISPNDVDFVLFGEEGGINILASDPVTGIAMNRRKNR